MITEGVIDSYPEIKIVLDFFPPQDKIVIKKFVNKVVSVRKKNSEDLSSLTRDLVQKINRAEIELTQSVIIFGASLALFQGQITEFKTLIESEISAKNPSIYNLLTLQALIFNGEKFKAFSWISKSLHVYVSSEKSSETDLINGEEIFTHSLSYYCYYLMGKLEEANNSYEEATRLHLLKKQKWSYFYFWLLYFRAKVSYNSGYFEESLQLTDEIIKTITNDLHHRIYQGLCMQLKGRALVGLEKYVEGLNYYIQAKSLFETTNSVLSISIYADIGILETKVGRYKKAKSSFQKTISETELLSGGGMKVAPLLQLPGYKGLGDLYLIQGNYFSAEDTYLKTLKLAKDSDEIELESYSLEMLGSINTDLKNYTIAQNYFIECLDLTSDFELNKTNTLLEYGRLALLMNNVDLALTQLWYLRSLSNVPKKTLGMEISIFKAQIMIRENKFDQARLELEKIQLRTIINDFLQIRIQIAIIKLVLYELHTGISSDDFESEEDCIDELVDRLNLIKPFLMKKNFPPLKILLTLLDLSSEWIKHKEAEFNIENNMSKLNEVSQLANNENSKLIHLNQLIDFYKRRFGRKRIRLGYNHIIDLIDNLERILILMSPKS